MSEVLGVSLGQFLSPLSFLIVLSILSVPFYLILHLSSSTIKIPYWVYYIPFLHYIAVRLVERLPIHWSIIDFLYRIGGISVVIFLASMGALVCVALSRWLRYEINPRSLSVRLWRIIAGIAILIAVNYGMLWLEKQPWAAELLR